MNPRTPAQKATEFWNTYTDFLNGKIGNIQPDFLLNFFRFFKTQEQFYSARTYDTTLTPELDKAYSNFLIAAKEYFGEKIPANFKSYIEYEKNLFDEAMEFFQNPSDEIPYATFNKISRRIAYLRSKADKPQELIKIYNQYRLAAKKFFNIQDESKHPKTKQEVDDLLEQKKFLIDLKNFTKSIPEEDDTTQLSLSVLSNNTKSNDYFLKASVLDNLQNNFEQNIQTINPGIEIDSHQGNIQISRERNSKIIASCIFPIYLKKNDPSIKFPGSISCTYEYNTTDHTWEIKSARTTDIRLKKLCNGEYNEFTSDKNPAHEIQHSLEILAQQKFTVSGRLAAPSKNLTITHATLTNGLQNESGDPTLTISPDPGEENSIIIKTTKQLKSLENLGIQKNNDTYKLQISKPDKDIAPRTGPILGMTVTVKNVSQSLDITHFYNTQELKAFSQNALAQPHKPLNLPNVNLFESIREINQYMKNRAGETSGFLSFFADSYSGKDYYLRRDNWTKILDKLNEYAAKQPATQQDLDDLTNFIDTQSNDKHIKKDTFFSRNNYSALLQKLKTTLEANLNTPIQPDLKNKISNYKNLYAQMKRNEDVTALYQQKYSIIDDYTSNQNHTVLRDQVAHERALYDLQYKLLDEGDKKDFMDMKEEFDSEYNNIRHYHY